MTTATHQKNSWYIETQRGIFGPYPKSKLSELFSCGSLKPAYLVSQDGIRWIGAGRLFGKTQAGRRPDAERRRDADRRLDADHRPASSHKSRSISSSRRPHGSGSRRPSGAPVQLGLSIAVLVLLIGVIAYMLSDPAPSNAINANPPAPDKNEPIQLALAETPEPQPAAAITVEPAPIETPAPQPVEPPKPAPVSKPAVEEPAQPVVAELDADLVRRFDALDALNKETVILSAVNAGSKTTGELRHFSDAKNVQLLADIKDGRLIITRRILTPDGTLADGQDRIHIFVPVSGAQYNRWYSKTAGSYMEIGNIGGAEGAVWGDCFAQIESLDSRTETFSISIKHLQTKDSLVKLGETFKAYIFARSDDAPFTSDILWVEIAEDICGYLKLPEYFKTTSNVVEIELGKK
ncbi:MAG: hypothetical protein ABIH86_04970 [Planctomycetota bacterium]